MSFELLENNSLLSWILSAIIGVATLYLVRFYVKVYNLPKGPFPYPLIGNILLFRGTKVNQFETIEKFREKHGSVFTLWMGNMPVVVVSDLELIRQAFNSKNNEFMGRPKVFFQKLLTQGKGSDVVFTDHGPVWASLRRVAHSAVRKLAASDKLSYLAYDSVDETVSIIIKKKGINTAFNPIDLIYLMIYNIIATSAFGKRYSFEDPEFNFIKDSFEYFRHNTNELAIVDRLPILKPFYYKTINKVSQTIIDLRNLIITKFHDHLKDHEKGVIRDFCDALIEAKEEAIIEEKETAPHLNDTNLSFVILNLFIAGSDTSNYMMRWIILFMANNTDMQIKMRKEIETSIGDRMPLHDDKDKCHYVMAFILECLRYKPVAPLGVPHRAMCDAKMGDYNIAEDTIVASFIWSIHHDSQYWAKPEQFDPTRFITSDGEVINTRNLPFIPFGVGRRICLGEKLAMADLFLITVRLLQSTSNYLIVLPDGDGSADLEPDPDIFFLNSPKPYQIILKSK